MTLDAAASPERVRELASMFADALLQIDPTLAEGDVTMVVENFSAAATLRGWRDAGRVAVRALGVLVENPMHAVQREPSLSNAARTIGSHAARLVHLGARFKRENVELAVVDEVFVRAMLGASTPRADHDGGLTGETIVHSTVLQVGRQSEHSRLKARVYVDGRPLNVDVDESLAEIIWDAAKSQRAIPVRLRGSWIEADDGSLRLDKPTIVSIDMTFLHWSGSELLAEARKLSSLFTSDDFDRMLGDLQEDRED